MAIRLPAPKPFVEKHAGDMVFQPPNHGLSLNPPKKGVGHVSEYGEPFPFKWVPGFFILRKHDVNWTSTTSWFPTLTPLTLDIPAGIGSRSWFLDPLLKLKSYPFSAEIQP